LVAHQPLLGLGRQPEVDLALGHDPARDHRVHPDPERAEIARHAFGQPLGRRLGGRVGGHAAAVAVPGDRAEVDNRAAARRLHRRGDGLDREELVADIGGLALVPVFGGHILPRVALVVGGVVGQDADGSQRIGRGGHRGAQRVDVAQVAAAEPGGGQALGRDRVGGRACGVPVDVEEAHPRALAGEMRDLGRADAAAAAGDQDRLAAQAGVGREYVAHGMPPAGYRRRAGYTIRRRREAPPREGSRAARSGG
jgi:hypothetical protein